MSTLKLLLAEIRYRKVNFLLSLFAITVAVALFVAGPLVIEGYRRQTNALLTQLEDKTRHYMRDMGFNLMIVNRETDMSDFWSDDFAKKTMPQAYVERLANDERLTKVTHLVATLQEKIEWQRRKVLLVGYLPETPQPLRPQTEFAKRREQARTQKLPMGEDIAPGTIHLGHELAAGRKEGETVEVLGKPFRLVRIVPERGSKEDITIKMRLSDAQSLLNEPGQINQILALECQCRAGDLPVIREQLEQVLPEAKVTEYQSMALARAKQREEVKANRQAQQRHLELFTSVSTSLVVLASAVWVGLLALLNVRERRSEIGLLRALGKGSARIACLLLGKAVLLGLLGAVVGFLLGAGIGFLLGTETARSLGFDPLYSSADPFHFPYQLLVFALVGAPFLSALASYLPTLSAITQDPAVVLRDH